MGHDGTGGAGLNGAAGLAPAGHGSGAAGAPGTGHGPSGHGAGRRVLVVEDEPNISEAIRFILRRDGWSVAVEDNGAEAVAAVERVAPEVVILDVMLPGLSGFEVLRTLRGRPETAALPVIMLTARGSNATREMAREAGASMFMAKPFANAELLAAVRQLVGV